MSEQKPQTHRKSKFRRKLMVYPAFQLGLVAINMLVLIGSFLLVGVQAARSFSDLRFEGARADLPQDHAYFHFIQYQENHLYGYMIWGVLIAIGVSLLVTMLYSHRLAGPILRLKSYLTQVAESGRRVPLEFREDDFFQELPYLVNEAFERVERESAEAAKGKKREAA